MRATLRPLGAFVHRVKLRTRVLVGVLAVTLIALAGFGYAAADALHGYLLAQTDSNLQAAFNEYRTLILKSGGTLPTPGGGEVSPPQSTRDRAPQESVDSPLLRVPAALDTYDIEMWGNGRPVTPLVGGNDNLIPAFHGTIPYGAQTATSANGQTQLRVLAKPVGNLGTLVVTTSLTSLDSTASRLQLIVIVCSLAAALVVVVGVRFVVLRGLRPVERMATAADKISAGDLTSRVRPDYPSTEVGRLGAALNGMLTRIEAAVRERESSEEATRRFFADASHELRTPLASMRANAELYHQGVLPRRSQVDEAMRRIAMEARRMGSLVDDMLRLARLDQQPGYDRKRVDLSSLAAECIERARVANRDYTWSATIAPDLVVMGDEELLRRAIDNMLANVAAHTPAGTAATLAVFSGPDVITIEISDNGPGVPEAELPHIFDRFYRTRAQTSAPGTGLGLAIVAATAAAHNGSVRAVANSPQGLRISLALAAGET
jgi:two-component system OmpR family sensor kinase